MRCSFALLSLLAFTAPAAASAANLDAPLRSAPPTLRTEIRRGADAALDCDLHRASVLDGDALLDCLNGVQSANRQRMGRGYEAFDAGLWYWGRESLQELMKADPSDPTQSNLDVAVAGLREAEKALGVTDDDVDRAIRTHR